MGGRLRLGGGALVGDPRPVALEPLDLAGRRASRRPSVSAPPRRLVCRRGRSPLRSARAAIAAATRPPRTPPLERGQRRSASAGVRSRRARPGALPAASCQRACAATMQRRCELLAGRRAGRLLFGLGGRAGGPGAELGQDVVDAREVRLRLGQLLLGLAPAPLVATDAGHLLEQRPALLGPQRQRLVDHALPDEQERVVGQVRVVQQVDEVAQPDALAVEEVLVLARAEQPPAELHLPEIDRQQARRRCRSRA